MRDVITDKASRLGPYMKYGGKTHSLANTLQHHPKQTNCITKGLSSKRQHRVPFQCVNSLENQASMHTPFALEVAY